MKNAHHIQRLIDALVAIDRAAGGPDTPCQTVAFDPEVVVARVERLASQNRDYVALLNESNFLETVFAELRAVTASAMAIRDPSGR